MKQTFRFVVPVLIRRISSGLFIAKQSNQLVVLRVSDVSMDVHVDHDMTPFFVDRGNDLILETELPEDTLEGLYIDVTLAITAGKPRVSHINP